MGAGAGEGASSIEECVLFIVFVFFLSVVFLHNEMLRDKPGQKKQKPLGGIEPPTL